MSLPRTVLFLACARLRAARQAEAPLRRGGNVDERRHALRRSRDMESHG
jgi:hypothetical protein